MKYTESHEWISVQNGIGTVGITHHAQKELGEVVYVELPQRGKIIKSGDEAAVLESTKAAADIYSPVSGEIIDTNMQLTASSHSLNESPEAEGWLFKIRLSNPKELDALLDRNQYMSLIQP